MAGNIRLSGRNRAAVRDIASIELQMRGSLPRRKRDDFARLPWRNKMFILVIEANANPCGIVRRVDKRQEIRISLICRPAGSSP